MSLSERLAQFRAEEQARTAQALIDQKEREKVWSDKYSAEVAGIKFTQNVLCTKLRKLGLIQSIEEFTGEKIFPVAPQPKNETRDGLPPLPVVWPSAEKFREALDRQTRAEGSEWRVVIPEPVLSTVNHTWNSDLRIIIGRLDYSARPGGGFSYLSSSFPDIADTALVHYSSEKVLTISGRNITYTGPLPDHLEIAEQALAKALHEPRLGHTPNNHYRLNSRDILIN